MVNHFCTFLNCNNSKRMSSNTKIKFFYRGSRTNSACRVSVLAYAFLWYRTVQLYGNCSAVENWYWLGAIYANGSHNYMVHTHYPFMTFGSIDENIKFFWVRRYDAMSKISTRPLFLRFRYFEQTFHSLSLTFRLVCTISVTKYMRKSGNQTAETFDGE